jgi:hypothetical protein
MLRARPLDKKTTVRNEFTLEPPITGETCHKTLIATKNEQIDSYPHHLAPKRLILFSGVW